MPADPFDVERLGQVFTPPAIVARMRALVRNQGRVLEPSCGDGAFSRHFPGCVAVELDSRHCPPEAINADFFTYPVQEGFATIIGNPPYVRYQDIPPATRRLLPRGVLDQRANLYLHFIARCLQHLAPGGELIFITPRDFLKTTSATRLNEVMYTQGTITDFIDLGDRPVFAGATPNCAIWRFVRDDFSRQTHYEDRSCQELRHYGVAGGHVLFTRGDYPLHLAEIATVRVGAVSGADAIFTHEILGNVDFVCSHTERSGQTRRMIWSETPIPHLERHKAQLLARRVITFDEGNWWRWGRSDFISERPRVYVNGRTRAARPFFVHDCRRYDGAVLALFPHDPACDVAALRDALNDVDWGELGFVCDGRHIFTQRSLMAAPLPAEFNRFLPGR